VAIITLFKHERPELKPTADHRGRTRLTKRIAITLSGTDAAGRTFREHCFTVAVSRGGAKVETMHDLPVGAEITIENQELGRASKGNVIWAGALGQGRGPYQVGICLTEAEDFWGVGRSAEAQGAILESGIGKNDLRGEAAPQPPEVETESGIANDAEMQPEPQDDSAATELTPQTTPPGESTPTLVAEEESGLPPTDADPQPESTEASGDEGPKPDDVPPALQATLMDFATKVQDAVETHSALFEQKLAKAADDVVARTEADLHSLAAGLEKKARAEFTERLVRIETRSKVCEEQLAQVADDVLARTEASLHGVASSLEDRAKSELAEQVETIETRLQESVSQAEAVLPKLHDASRYESEIQKARQSLIGLTSGAVEFALEEVNELIADQLRPVALDLVAETRQRVEREGAESLEALLHGKGAARLDQWFTEGLQAHVSAMEARLQEVFDAYTQRATEKVHTQLENLIMQGAEQARQKCEGVVCQTLEAMNKRADEVARALNEKVEEVELRLRGLLAEVVSHSESASAALQKQADEVGNRVVERIERESGVLADAVCDRVLKANEIAEQKREEVVGQTAEALNKHAEEAAKGLNERVEQAEQRVRGLLAEATSRSEAASTALQQQADELGNRVVERIERESGVLAEAACDRVLKANELAEQKREEVIGQTTEALNKRADEVARGLNEKVGEVELRLRGLQAEVVSLSESASTALQKQAWELGNSVLEKFEKESGVLADAACDRVLKANELAEQKKEEIIGQTAEALNKHAEEVAKGLNERVEQVEQRVRGLLAETTSRSELASAALEKQAWELSNSVLEKIQKESGVLADAACDRVLKADELAEQKREEVIGQTAEALNKHADEAAKGLHERVEQVEQRVRDLLAEATSHSEAASATLQKQAWELSNSVLEKIQKESAVVADAACDRVLKANELAEQRREEVIGQTAEVLNKHAEEAAKSLNERIEQVEQRVKDSLAQATSHSEAASAALEKQAWELGAGVLEKIQKESGMAADAACDRVLKANELAEQKSVEAAESRIKAVIQGLTESAEVHLQAMAEEKGKEFVDLMTHNRQRLVKETAVALRAKIAEILMILQRADASEGSGGTAEAAANDADLVRHGPAA